MDIPVIPRSVSLSALTSLTRPIAYYSSSAGDLAGDLPVVTHDNPNIDLVERRVSAIKVKQEQENQPVVSDEERLGISVQGHWLNIYNKPVWLSDLDDILFFYNDQNDKDVLLEVLSGIEYVGGSTYSHTEIQVLTCSLILRYSQCNEIREEAWAKISKIMESLEAESRADLRYDWAMYEVSYLYQLFDRKEVMPRSYNKGVNIYEALTLKRNPSFRVLDLALMSEKEEDRLAIVEVIKNYRKLLTTSPSGLNSIIYNSLKLNSLADLCERHGFDDLMLDISMETLRALMSIQLKIEESQRGRSILFRMTHLLKSEVKLTSEFFEMLCYAVSLGVSNPFLNFKAMLHECREYITSESMDLIESISNNEDQSLPRRKGAQYILDLANKNKGHKSARSV